MAQGMLEEGRVDGVPVFVVAAPTTPTAVLTFRTGLIDETLTTAGWTHLLEHLTLHEESPEGVEQNGAVDLVHTRFLAQGDQAAVEHWLEGVAGRLAAPALSELTHERNVLRAEGARRVNGPLQHHLDLRYGPRGPGLAGYQELGLNTATEAGLRSWAQNRFVAGNAALALSFEPSPALRLPLTPGPRSAIPDPPASLVPGRAWATESSSDRFVVSGLVTAGWLSAVLGGVATDAVSTRLRGEDGASYATSFVVERLGPRALQLLLDTDVLPEARGAAASRIVSIVRSLAEDGVPPATLRRVVERERRRLLDDPYRFWQATQAATLVLRDEPVVEHQELLDRLEQLTPEDLHDDLRTFEQMLLLTVPPRAVVEDGLGLQHTTGIPEVDISPAGRRYRHDDPRLSDRLAIDREVLEIRNGERFRRVRVDTAQAYLAYPGGARTLVGAAGDSLTLDPMRWRQGDRAVAEADAVIDPALRIDMPDGGPGRYRPLSATQRLRAWATRALVLVVDHPARALAAFVAGFVVCALLVTRVPGAWSYALAPPFYLCIIGTWSSLFILLRALVRRSWLALRRGGTPEVHVRHG